MKHKHRILPGHMGGTYAADNVELLTVAEHAEAHRLLWVFHGKPEDRLAWRFLSGQINLSEAAVERQAIGKRKAALAQRNPTLRAYRSAKRKGVPLSLETRANMSAAQRRTSVIALKRAALKGRPNPKISEAKRGVPNPKLSALRKGVPLSQYHKDRISASMKGIVFTEEHKANLRLAHALRRQRGSHE